MTSDSSSKKDPLRSQPDSYWKERLTPEQYKVARQHGTEPPFSGKYVEFDEQGNYSCICCGEILFSSETKFDAGCGWPSFWESADPSKIELKDDLSFMMHRIEVLCKNCGAHLGHVFDDGPKPTGQRFCINSVSLNFVPKK
jgi:peptide-methionine (R)-S-oxide reductase